MLLIVITDADGRLQFKFNVTEIVLTRLVKGILCPISFVVKVGAKIKRGDAPNGTPNALPKESVQF